MLTVIKRFVFAICLCATVAGCSSDGSELTAGTGPRSETASQDQRSEDGGDVASQDDEPAIQEEDTPTEEVETPEDEGFSQLREFMETHGKQEWFGTRLVADPEDGRVLSFGVWEQSHLSDAYVLAFWYEPSCSAVNGTLRPALDEPNTFVWRRGRPADGGFVFPDVLCSPEWTFEPALSGDPYRADISIDEVTPSRVTMTIDGVTEQWKFAPFGQ
jgi:hypothetical protein